MVPLVVRLCYARSMVFIGLILVGTAGGLTYWGYRVGWLHGSKVQFELDLIAFKRELLKVSSK